MLPNLRRWLAAAAAVALLVSGGCSDGGAGPDPTPQVVTVHLTAGLEFSPADVTIAPGTRVRWVNDAAVAHTVTPDNAAQAGAWATTALNAQGATFEHTFNAAGTFNYHCIPHAPGMSGVIRVQ
jgi:plastocyanin